MLEFHFIRHAESEGNLHPEIIGGQSNHLPLTENGRRQARKLALRYAQSYNAQSHLLFSSTAVRTQETARIFCETLSLNSTLVKTDARLLELSQGDWVGHPRDEVYTPQVLANIQADNWNFKAPRGESQREVEERVYEWINEQLLENQHQKKIFLVFSHGVAIKCLVRRILQSSPRMTYKIRIENTAVTQFNFHTDKGWSLERLNDTGHLLLI